jgi:hypothetical protein
LIFVSPLTCSNTFSFQLEVTTPSIGTRSEKYPPACRKITLNDAKRFDYGLKAIVAAETQAFQQRRQHAPVMARELALHYRLTQEPQFWSACTKLRYEIVERFFLDLGEDYLPHNAVGLLDYSLSHA